MSIKNQIINQNTTRLTGAQALVKILTSCGVKDYYGVCGGNLVGIFGAIHNSNVLRYIGCRHEASGVFMAAATFNSTQKLAVTMGELGPGTMNLASGLGFAFNNNLPVLAITSSWPNHKISPLIGTLMELDGIKMTQAVTKWSSQIRQIERIPNIVRWAVREALTGRPGPVHLDFPNDVLKAEYDFPNSELDTPFEYFMPAGRTPASKTAIDKAISEIEKSKKILMIGGGGVIHSGATKEFRALASQLGAASTCTQMGIGVVSTASPDFIGHAGALGGEPIIRACEEADLVIAVGCKFSSWLKNGVKSFTSGWPNQSIIHIDIDPSAIGKTQPCNVGLVGDAKLILQQLLENIDDNKSFSSKDWLDSLIKCQAQRQKQLDDLVAEPSSKDAIHPAKAAKIFGEWLPQNSMVVYDGGHTTFWANDYTPALEPATRFNDSGMAQLGFGNPFANALKLQFPENIVINYIGDGSFGFTIMELDTARRYGLNVIHMIHNNSSWGVIEQAQIKSGFELGTIIEGTDYASIAKGFGCYGEVVTSADEIKNALNRAIASKLPAVIDIRTSFEVHPSHKYFGASLN